MLEKMRIKDRELKESEAREILIKGEHGTLSTFGDEYPYAVPVNYVVEDNKIYIHGTCVEGQKTKNIQKNPKVCFTVVGSTELMPSKFGTKYESAVVFGTAALCSNNDEKQMALEKFIDKYSSEFRESGMKYIKSAIDKVSIYKISIDVITGKANK